MTYIYMTERAAIRKRGLCKSLETQTAYGIKALWNTLEENEISRLIDSQGLYKQ